MNRTRRDRGLRPARLAQLVFGIALALAPAAKAAEPSHPFLETFGSTAQPSFGSAKGLAVDQATGDLLVIDSSAQTVSRYHEDGTPSDFSALDTNVIDGVGVVPPAACTPPSDECDGTPAGELSFGGANEVQVAVDNSGTATDGDIYVTQSGEHLIDIFSAEGEYLGQLTKAGATNFGEACGVAVDESGAVYVGDYEGEVHKFEPSANPPVNTDNTANFTATTPCALAAGAGPSAGSIFVTEYFGEVTKLDSSTGAEKYVVSAGVNTTVSVDPTSGHLYVAKGEEVAEYDASGASAPTEPVSTIAPEEGAFAGVAVNEGTGNVYVTRADSPNVEVFGPLTYPPTVTTLAEGTVTQHAAVLNATVDNNAAAAGSSCVFEIALASDPGYELAVTVPCETTPVVGDGDVAVIATAAGLSARHNYIYRVLATDAAGSTQGADEPFSTPFNPPGVSGESAGALGQTAATLAAMVDPNNSPTTCEFEWGPSAAYGNTVPCEPDPGSGPSPVGVTIPTLTGLTPNTTYHFRVKASNSGGASEGADKTFTTLPHTCATEPSLCPNPAVGAPALAPAPEPRPTPLKCRKGFKKRTVKGKTRCVRGKKHSRHHRTPSNDRRAGR
jgi:hypothetical protein